MDEIDAILETSAEKKAIGKITARDRTVDIEDLRENIRYATHINEGRRAMFLRLSELFLSDLANNLFKSQFELIKKYPDTTADEWVSFLTDNMVAKYIGRHKDVAMISNAEANVADVEGKGKKESIGMIDKINAKIKEESKQNIVIIRLPQKGN